MLLDSGSQGYSWISSSIADAFKAYATNCEETFQAFNGEVVTANKKVTLYFRQAGSSTSRDLCAEFLIANHETPWGMEMWLGANDCHRFNLLLRGVFPLHIDARKLSPGTPRKILTPFPPLLI
jgi:hypothetical protein